MLSCHQMLHPVFQIKGITKRNSVNSSRRLVSWLLIGGWCTTVTSNLKGQENEEEVTVYLHLLHLQLDLIEKTVRNWRAGHEMEMVNPVDSCPLPRRLDKQLKEICASWNGESTVGSFICLLPSVAHQSRKRQNRW